MNSTRIAFVLGILCIAFISSNARSVTKQKQLANFELQASDLPVPTYDDLAELVAKEVSKLGSKGRQLLARPDMGRLAAVTAKRISSVVSEDKFIDLLATKIMADLDFSVKEEIQKAVAAKKVDIKVDLNPGAGAAPKTAEAAGTGN